MKGIDKMHCLKNQVSFLNFWLKFKIPQLFPDSSISIQIQPELWNQFKLKFFIVSKATHLFPRAEEGMEVVY